MSTAPGARSEPTSVRIIDAATNQFFERGYHGTSIKELAAEAGVRSATLYYHFPSKEEILVAIMRSTLTELAEVVETTTIPEHGAVAQLRTAVTTHIRFHVDHHREVGPVPRVENRRRLQGTRQHPQPRQAVRGHLGRDGRTDAVVAAVDVADTDDDRPHSRFTVSVRKWVAHEIHGS